MPDSPLEAPLLLPERARLLHIGPMKTGTTSLQSVARKRRAELRDHGVLYPGKRLNHRRPVGALTGRGVALHAKSGSIHPADGHADGVPPRREWDELVAEIDADESRRVLISHELIGDSSDKVARLFIDELGPRTHVVITLRAPAVILPSLWVQSLKSAKYEQFDHWLERAFSLADPPMTARFRRAQNQAGLVERWSRIAGPDNVTVVIAESSRPALLEDAFEDMLGLPRDFLRDPDRNGFSANRSMTLPEAEHVRSINETLAAESIGWDTYVKVVRNGVVGRILGERIPPQEEARVRLPDWAAKLATRRGAKFARKIAESGVRVIGDLNSLFAVPPPPPGTSTENLSPDLGVESVVGAVLASSRQSAKKPAKTPASPAKPPSARASQKSTRKLPLGRRLVKRLSRRSAAIARRLSGPAR